MALDGLAVRSGVPWRKKWMVKLGVLKNQDFDGGHGEFSDIHKQQNCKLSFLRRSQLGQRGCLDGTNFGISATGLKNHLLVGWGLCKEKSRPPIICAIGSINSHGFCRG